MLKINKKKLKPYGDRLDDGAMQLSFTLPVDASPEAKEAARLFVEKLGLRDASISAMESMGSDFTYFVAYGYAKHTIDITRIKVPKVEVPVMHYDELKEYMERNLDRAIVVIGAATGSDAHTVGIDAIMNMKGYAHDYGLERYPLFKAHNLRSQLTNQQLIDKAVELEADAILISQVVTQRDSHVKNLKEFRDLWKKDKRVRKEVMVIIGGPRLDHAHALKLGFDAGFGPGTKPSWVGGFIVHEFMKRHHMKERAEGKPHAEKKPHAHATTRPRHVPAEKRPHAHATTRPRHAPAEKRVHKEKKVEHVAHTERSHHSDEVGKQPPKKRTRRGKRGGRRRRKTKTASPKAD
jgi:beta-lysine 5,6-aminomutase beta subunit